MKMQGKNVAHAAIADDLFLNPNPPNEAIGLGKGGGQAVINKCRLEVLDDGDETRRPDVSSFLTYTSTLPFFSIAAIRSSSTVLDLG